MSRAGRGGGRGDSGGRGRGSDRGHGPALEIPLPKKLRELIGGDAAKPLPNDNLGLWLDKFVRRDSAKNWTLKAEARVDELERLFCPHSLGDPLPWRADAAQEAIARLEASCAALYGEGRYRSMAFRVRGRLLVDYGRSSATEISVSMHPVLGCPRIPGSALKGVLRGFLRREWGADSPRLRELLGPEPSQNAEEHEGQRGRLVIHDALPDVDFQLAVDVLTPHARDYYEGKDKKDKKDKQAVPADWVGPIPHTFLTVVETRFRVFMGMLPSAREGEDGEREKNELEQVAEVLEKVLILEGVGAKRAAGYGRLRREA